MPESSHTPDCKFCDARDGSLDVAMVLDEPEVLAFLDYRPLFKGHVLVVPRQHHVTMFDLPSTLIDPLFGAVQRISIATKAAMQSDGIFNAVNNVISQSVAHLHIHVVPRNKKDGLRGFMWPRLKYENRDEMDSVAEKIRMAL